MKQIIINSFPFLLNTNYDSIKLSPNRLFIASLFQNNLSICSLTDNFKRSIENVNSYNWATLRNYENLIYQSNDRLYIFDPHSNSSFVLQTLPSNKLVTIESYGNSFIVISPLDNNSYEISIYDSSLRLFSVILPGVICFSSSHRLSVFIQTNGLISVLSPEEPHHIHAYLPFLTSSFKDVRSFSFSKQLKQFVFCNGKKLLVFTPITRLSDEPYRELIEMDTKNPSTFTSFELNEMSLSEKIIVSQTGIYIIQQFNNEMVLSKVGCDDKIVQNCIHLIDGTILPVFINGNQLIAVVNGESRRMLLTLINGGFSSLINYITDLNPQFAVDSADSRILITLEHALETIDASEADKAVDKLIEKGDSQLLSAGLKIFVDHLGIETPHEVIRVCLRMCKEIAQKDLMRNIEMLSEAMRKIGSAEEELRKAEKQRRYLEIQKVFGDEIEKRKQRINETFKLIEFKQSNLKMNFDDIVLNGNIPLVERNDSNLIMKAQALCFKKAQEGNFELAVKIALRIGINDLNKMLLTIITNTTDSELRQGCIGVYQEIEQINDKFDIEFINTYDYQKHTKKLKKFDVLIQSNAQDMPPFEGDISSKASEKFEIPKELISSRKQNEIPVIRVNDILNANSKDKSNILTECGETRKCVDDWEVLKYFVSHNKEMDFKEWVQNHLSLLTNEKSKLDVWRYVQYYSVNPSKRVMEEYLTKQNLKPEEECWKDKKQQLICPHKSLNEKLQYSIIEEYKLIDNLPLIDCCIEKIKLNKLPSMWMNQIKALHVSYEEAILINTLKHLDAPVPNDGDLKKTVFNLLISKPRLSNILEAFFEGDINKETNTKANKLKGVCQLTTTKGDLSLTQLYSNAFQSVYDPLIEGPFGFVPRSSISQNRNWLNSEYYITQKQCVLAKQCGEISNEKLCELIVKNDQSVRTCCSFISNDPYVQLVTILHEDLQPKYEYIFKHYPLLQILKSENGIDYNLLLKSNQEIKEEFVKCYDELHGSSYPPTKGWDRLGFLSNTLQIPLRTMQLQILSRKQAFLETLIFADKHGFKWNDVKDVLLQYSGDFSMAKHISTALGALSKTDGNRGLLTILLESSPLEAFSIFIGSTKKTIESTKERILEMVQEDISCRLLRTGFFLFDSKNALRYFFDVCGTISQTNFNDSELIAQNIDLKLGLIGNEEWRKNVIEDCLDIIVNWWQQRSPTRLEKLIGSLKGMNLGEKVELKIRKYCNVLELIEKTQIDLKLTEDPNSFIDKMTKSKYFEEAYHHINEFEPRFLFNVIEKEANQLVGRESWRVIDKLLEKRKAPALEATNYYQTKIDELVKKRNETNYQLLNKEIVVVLELKEKWFNVLERQNVNGIILQLHAENKQMLATYQQAIRENVPVEALINPTVESVYYVLNTSNYTLAQQMNEIVHAEEIEIFNKVFQFVTNQQSYGMKIEEGISVIEKLCEGTSHINPIIELLKIRYEIIHKYFEDKSLVLVVLTSSADYNSKVIEFLQVVCGPKVLSKYSNKIVEWCRVFEDAKRFVEAERIDQNELGKILANNFIEVTNTVKPVCVMGWSTPNIMAYLNIFSNVADIVKPLLNLLENVTTTNTLAESLILCHTAAKIANSTELMKDVLTKIQKSLIVFLIPHNHSYLVRVITRTKAYDDVRIPRVNEPPVTLVKYFITEALADKEVDYRVILPKHDQKDAFETSLYYQSDLAEIKDETGIVTSSLYETLFAETYSYLNASLEGGNLFFNKAKKIVESATNKMVSKKGSVEEIVPDLIEAMGCYCKASGFFCNGEEYYWANKCGHQMNLLALQMFYNNVQIVGLTTEKAKNQLMFISSIEDAVLFAAAYDLLELHHWIPSIFEQCFVRQHMEYIGEWRRVFTLDSKTWNELIEYIDRPQKQIKKRDLVVLREQFMKKCKCYWPELFCCQDGIAMVEGIIKPEIKEMIQNARIVKDIYITEIVALDDENNFDN